ncbi:hypothetical protein FRC17_009057, partial [Serendipita sp. 399]
MSSVSLPLPAGSAKLYATAKKEWVIAPRAKPGRKPKQIIQDEAEYMQDDASEKGKKTQNRAAQRAFRERRQSQLAELQVRLQQYEQGEVERNVALQQLGKRLKEENELLKQENSKLKEENEQLKARLAAREGGHAAAAVPSTSMAYPTTTRKTAKRDRSDRSPPLRHRLKRLKTTDSPVLHPSSMDTPSISSCGSTNVVMSPMITAFDDDDADIMAIDTCDASNFDASIQEDDPDYTSCGMCTSSVDCLCRQLGIDNRAPITIADEPSGSLSLLNNLPPYQPAVPLRHRRKSVTSSDPKAIHTRSGSQATSLGCSGDPSNCSACADNAFGRAFCSALGSSVCTGEPCSKCHSTSHTPSGTKDASTSSLPSSINPALTQCCGKPERCHGDACLSTSSAETRPTGGRADVDVPPISKKARAMDSEMRMDDDGVVPCDVVWKTLEAHPNSHLVNPDLGPSHLANLNLLAEVVARRSRCTLAPGEPTPEPEDFPLRARPTRDSPQPTQQVRNDGVAAPRLQIGYEEEEFTPIEADRIM